MPGTLPKRTLEYLEHGAPEGQRHNELLAATCQLRDNGYLLHEAERLLGSRAERDGLTEHEWRVTVRGVYATAARKPIESRTQTDLLPGQKPQPFTQEERNAFIERKCRERLAARARTMLPSIMEIGKTPGDFFSESPVNVGEPEQEWRMLLGLFDPEDVVWIGETKDSCDDNAPEIRKSACRLHFLRVSDWLLHPRPLGHFTCPSAFYPGTHSRSDKNVRCRKFLVVESDVLTKEQICCVFQWLRAIVVLRAIVDTGGKSLHGWFDVPRKQSLDELKIVLPIFGCDPALFKAPQPVRIPGIRRDNGNFQSLLYLAP